MIYTGDCMDIMDKMIKDNVKVTMTLTDIPYNEVNSKGEERSKYGKQLRKLDKHHADVLSFDLVEFLEKITQITEGSVYIFCGINQIGEIYGFFNKHKDFMVRQCVWKKTNPSPFNGQHMWLSSFENCIFAKRRKTPFYESCKSSVWEFPSGKSKMHPTQKPIDLFEYLIKSSSEEGDVIFDPCMGSGTTGVACKKLGRDFIGVDIESHNCRIAKHRIRNLF